MRRSAGQEDGWPMARRWKVVREGDVSSSGERGGKKYAGRFVVSSENSGPVAVRGGFACLGSEKSRPVAARCIWRNSMHRAIVVVQM